MRALLIVIILLQFTITYGQENTEKKTKGIEFVMLPQPTFNEVQGTGIALTTGIFYSMNKGDEFLKPSATLIHGFYSQNNTWVGAIIQESFFHNNDYWLKVVGVKSTWNYQYYQEFKPEIIQDKFIQYSTDLGYFEYSFLRRIKGDFYSGIYGKYSSFHTEFDIEDSILPTQPSREATYNGLGFMFAFDNRYNILNPSKGVYSEFKLSKFHNTIGSDKNFAIMEFNLNYYKMLGQNGKSILASKFYTKVGLNDVPFEEEAVVGMAGTKHNSPRGYTNGRYRGNQMYSLQCEWRYNFYNNWGMVTFGSVSITGDNGTEIKENGILPAIGLGIRYMAIESQKINIGIDIAKGKNDMGIYFTIGEAF